MAMCFEMHFRGQMGCVSLNASFVLETLKSLTGTLCSTNIGFYFLSKVATTLLMLVIQMAIGF
jgi:hypothetical protein